MQAIEHEGAVCLSFKQLDELNALPKGSSFRVFKRVRDGMQEGRDYFYLSAAEHAQRIEQLRRQGLIYSTSPNLVLITERGYQYMQRYR